MSALFRRIRPGTSSKHTLFLLHGLGSDEQDMFGLAHELDPRFTVICLRAPKSYGPGYSWFPIEWTPTGISMKDEDAEKSLEMLADELPSERDGIVLVGGFSQGSMMSSGILSKHSELIDGAVLLSGRIIPSFFVNPPEALVEIPVFIAHGELDEVLTFDQGTALKEQVSGISSNVEWHAYRMGHTVSLEEIRDLNVWLGQFKDQI